VRVEVPSRAHLYSPKVSNSLVAMTARIFPGCHPRSRVQIPRWSRFEEDDDEQRRFNHHFAYNPLAGVGISANPEKSGWDGLGQ
jgi:hypothetical protein